MPQAFAEQPSPVLDWLITANGQVSRRTLLGVFSEEALSDKQRKAFLAYVAELRGEAASFSHAELGLLLAGTFASEDTGQARLAVASERAWRAEDWQAAISESVFVYLQALAASGQHLWIVGDTGAEMELAYALCARGGLVRGDGVRPAALGFVPLAEVSIAEAMKAKRQGGFAQLLWSGVLDPEFLLALEASSGAALVQRAQNPETALQRSGLQERPELAASLTAFSAVVTLGSSIDGAVHVARVAEFRSADGGLELTVAAERSGREPLRFSRRPQSVNALLAAGAERAVESVPSEEAPVDVDLPRSREVSDQQRLVRPEPMPIIESEAPRGRRRGAQSIRQGAKQRRQEATIEEDPGWELDALGSDALITAPGDAGSDGLLRARPLVRPAAPTGNPEEPGDLVLDAPTKIMIPEAPSSSRAKRTFAEILRERHRYPPMSADGSPTLTPPVLPEHEDDDSPAEPVGEDEDITP